jgi:hypothetical protein
MACKLFKMEVDNTTIVGISCGRSKYNRCYICGKPATKLCDYPISDTETCDKPMCQEHAHNIGKDNDVCNEHYNRYGIEKAKTNRKVLEKKGWDISNNYICPVCENEEHSDDAKFCKICGKEISRRISE